MFLPKYTLNSRRPVFLNQVFVGDSCEFLLWWLWVVGWAKEHLVQDPDESQMISRAFVSFVHFNNPTFIVHPLLVFVSDLVWAKVVAWKEELSCFAEGFAIFHT